MYSNTNDKVKKQQVLVPLRNFATTAYDQNNLISPMLHLDGTNEVSPLRAPTTVFVNGDNREADQSYTPMEGQQSDDNDEAYQEAQEAPIEDNSYNTAYSFLFGNEMENYNDDNNDVANMAFADDSRQAPYDDQSNERYVSQANDEEENAPVRTMTKYNRHDINYLSGATEQGALVPTLSSLTASRIKAINRLTSLGQQQSTITSPNYASLVKQLLIAQAQGVKASSRVHSVHPLTKTPKIDNGTQSHNQTQVNSVDKTKVKVEDAEKQELEYKKNVKNAELTANLAEAAKTLTKLVNKLTVQDAIISKKGEEGLAAKKNNSRGL